MPRPRLNDTGLPPRLYRHRAGYRYVPRVGKPVPLGADLVEALKKYRIIREQEAGGGQTIGWLIDWYLANLATLAPRNKPATVAEKHAAAEQLRRRIGHIPFRELTPALVRDYLDLGVTEGRDVRANREKALLSHAYSCARERGLVADNPCLRVRPNHEAPKDRYHEDGEALAVLAHCNPSTWAVAMLVYRTLQRPVDILTWTAANILERDGARVLSFVQSKTGARVEIAITPELDEVFAKARGDRKVVGLTLIHNRRAQPYTTAGIKANWQKACAKAGVRGFGIYDLKAKGATEMHQAGVPIAVISQLCGHQSVTTTETYIKRHLRHVIAPNARRMRA